MTGVSVANLNRISETLLLPLFSRAREDGLVHGILKDPLAAEMVDRLVWDFSRLRKLPDSQHFCVALRSREFDRRTRLFLKENPEGLVVEMGAGLSTRFERINSPKAKWISLDYPETYQVYKEFFKPHARKKWITGDFTDIAWMDQVLEEARGNEILLLAEGVLMYLPPKKIKTMLGKMASRFAGAEIMFDYCSSFFAGRARKHPMAKHTKAEFMWGAGSNQDLADEFGNLKPISTWYYAEQPETRLGMIRRLRFIQLIRRSFAIGRFMLTDSAPVHTVCQK